MGTQQVDGPCPRQTYAARDRFDIDSKYGNDKNEPNDPGLVFRWQRQARVARHRFLDKFLLPGRYERKLRRDFLTKARVQREEQIGHDVRATDGFVNMISEAPRTHRIVCEFVKFSNGSKPQARGSSRLSIEE